MLLAQNGRWTWARRGAQRVALKDSKVGFTSILTICADGTVTNLLMHWAGGRAFFGASLREKRALRPTTDRSHASVQYAHHLIEQGHDGPFQRTIMKAIIPEIRSRTL